jgi:ribosome modulation factor
MNKTIKFALTEAYEKGYEDGIKASINDINWEEQNKMREQWLLDNPNKEYEGWISI